MTLNRCQALLPGVWIHGEGPTHHTPRCLMVLEQRTSSTHIFRVMPRWIITDSPRWAALERRFYYLTRAVCCKYPTHTWAETFISAQQTCKVRGDWRRWLEQNERKESKKIKQNRTGMFTGYRDKDSQVSGTHTHIAYIDKYINLRLLRFLSVF